MRKAANMAVKEKSENVSDEIEWNVDTEVQLFYAMHGHKPVGVNKYFQMACILEKFSNSINKDISSQVIWNHLDTMYDLQALDDTENLPFPNDEKEFSLPLSEFATLMEEKRKSILAGDSTSHENEKKRESVKKEVLDRKENSYKDVKESPVRKEIKDINKDNRRDFKEVKEPKKSVNKEMKEIKRETKEVKEVKRETKELKEVKRETKEVKEVKRESKEVKELKKESKREVKETPKEVRKEPPDPKEQKLKPRLSIKEKRDAKKDDDSEDTPLIVKKERTREVSESKNEESPKRTIKRPTRGSIKPDDVGHIKSSSPVTTATPPPLKRRRT